MLTYEHLIESYRVLLSFVPVAIQIGNIFQYFHVTLLTLGIIFPRLQFDFGKS